MLTQNQREVSLNSEEFCTTANEEVKHFYIGLCSTLMALRREFYRATHGMKRNFLLIGADPGLRDCKGGIPWRNSGVLVSMSYSKF